LETRLRDLRARRTSGLAPYVTAGDGGLDSTLAILHALERAGAACVELGFPFSDPIADGPTLQAASQRAIEAGATFEGVLQVVQRFRAEDGALPIAWMSYANPLLRRGSFAVAAREIASAGCDALLVPDLPIEEAAPMREAALGAGLAPIFFGAPTSSDERLARAAELSRGFLYVVGRLGVTGRSIEVDLATREYLERARRAARDLPLAVGFGIGAAEQVRAVARYADLAIVGSALVDRLLRARRDAPERAPHEAERFLAELSRGLTE
jgi:tryptophan synthase alpha chain